MHTDISFPDKPILEIKFLHKSDFFNISFRGEHYTIIGGDKDIETNLIGIDKNEKVFYITRDDNSLCYIASDIKTFINELLLFDEFANTEENILPKNPNDAQLLEYADRFKEKILKLDGNAFDSEQTYWSEVYEEMVYGII